MADEAQLPTATQAFGPPTLPTASEAFPPAQPLPDRPGVADIVKAFAGAYGEDMDAVRGEDAAEIKKLKEWTGYDQWTAGHRALAQAAKTILIGPSLQDFLVGLHTPSALFTATQAATEKGAEAAGASPQLARDIAALPEVLPFGPEQVAGTFRAATPHDYAAALQKTTPEDILEAHALGVVHPDGEAAWKGTAQAQSAEDAARASADAAKAAKQPPSAIRVTPTPQWQPPADEVPAAQSADEVTRQRNADDAAMNAALRGGPSDIHEAAHAIDPAAVDRYNELDRTRNVLRGWLSDFRAQRDEEWQANAPHTAEIDDLQRRLAGPEAAGRRRATWQQRLDTLQAEQDEYLAHRPTDITPSMQTVIDRLRVINGQIDADLIARRNAAYAEAERRYPQFAPREEPAPVEAAPPTRDALAAQRAATDDFLDARYRSQGLSEDEIARLRTQRHDVRAQRDAAAAPIDVEGTIAAATTQAARRPIVETPMPTGANSSKDTNGPVYVDPSVPEHLRGPVKVHETVEQELQAKGMSYDEAHKYATAAEKRAVEADGQNWNEYEKEWDGKLAHIEHEKVPADELPKDLHVSPQDALHHANKAAVEEPAPAAETAPAPTPTPAKPIAGQRAFIVNDVAAQYRKAHPDHSQAEAEAAGEFWADHFITMAGLFQGKLGTAEELYLKEAPQLHAPGQRSPYYVRGARRAPTATRAPSLLEFIASRGGLKPDPDLEALGLNSAHRVNIPGRAGRFAVVRDGGMTLDQMREAAEEAGYLRPGAMANVSTIREFLDALDSELRGERRFPIGEEEAAVSAAETERGEDLAAERAAALAPYRARIEAMLKQAGTPLDSVPEADIRTAAGIMADEGLGPEEALERAAIRNHEEEEELRRTAEAAPGLTDEDLNALFQREGETAEHPGQIHQRLPTAVGSDLSGPTMKVDVATMKRETPEVYAHNARLLAPYLPKRFARMKPDAITQAFKKLAADNLVWLYNQIPEAVRERSKLWYVGGRRVVEDWSERYGVHDTTVAGVLAALSPKADWYKNVSWARRVFTIHKAYGPEFYQNQKATAAMRQAFADAPTMAKYAPAWDLIKNASLGDIDRMPLTGGWEEKRAWLKALWTRFYDEAHHTSRYGVMTPEGDVIDIARTTQPAEGAAFVVSSPDGREVGRFTDRRTANREAKRIGGSVDFERAPGAAGWGGGLGPLEKAIRILEHDGDHDYLQKEVGTNHKVRNFYNNLLAPFSRNGAVTIDTHAVAALLLRPLSQEDEAVKHNFGDGEPGRPRPRESNATGIYGTYPFMADVYRDAAARLGILPRELQSITWEAVRQLFPAAEKSSLRSDIDAIWSKYRNGDLTANAARRQILKAATPDGQIPAPVWYGRRAAVAGPAADARELLEPGVLRQPAEGDLGRGGGGLPRLGQEVGPEEIGGRTFFQGGRLERGKISLNPLGPPGLADFLGKEGIRPLLRFTKNADASTFIHESGHLFLANLLRYSTHPDAPEQMRADAATVMRQLARATEVPFDRVEDLAREHHEQFARWVEQYAREGVAPSPALGRVFAMFREWLSRIYPTLEKLGTPLNEDVRGVIDRLLAQNPERTQIIPERPAAKEFDALHEERAGATPLERGDVVGDAVLNERDSIASQNLIEEENAARLANARAEAGERPPGGTQPPGARHAPEPLPGEGGVHPPVGAVGAGGSEAPAEGAGAREEPARAAEVKIERPASPDTPFAKADTKLVDKIGNFRIDGLDVPSDIDTALREAAARRFDFMTERRGNLSLRERYRLARASGLDPSFIDGKRIGDAYSAEEVMMLEEMFTDASTRVQEAAANRRGDPLNLDLVLKHVEAMARLEMIQGKLAGATAEAGRTLAAVRRIVKQKWSSPQALSIELERVTGRTLAQSEAMAAYSEGLSTPAQQARFVADTANGRVVRGVRFIYYNVLLSGPVTHLRYAVGNILGAVWQPLVRTPIAAAIGSTREMLGSDAADRVYWAEVPAQLYGLVRGSQQGLRAGLEGWQTGSTARMPGGADVFGAQPMTPPIPGRIGQLISIPGRAVGFIHSFSEAVRYEQEIASLSYRQARMEGLVPGSEEFVNRVSFLSDRPDAELMTPLERERFESLDARLKAGETLSFVEQEQHDRLAPLMAKQTIMEQAAAKALRELYMDPTEYDSLLGRLSRISHDYLVAGLIAPFVKMGGKIVSRTFEQTPLGLIKGTPLLNFRIELNDNIAGKNGAAARDMQYATIAAGTALMAATAGYVLEGNMTGDGPSDPKRRATWLLQHPANSINIGGHWISYARLGSLGMLMRLTANMVDGMRGYGDEEKDALATNLMYGFTHAVLDETFVSSLKDALDALDDPDRYGKTFIVQQLMKPIPVGFGQIAGVVDPYRRDTRGDDLADTLFRTAQSKVPLWSEGLPPRRDMFGEPVPAAGPAVNYANDPVAQRMEALGMKGIAYERKIAGVPLTAAQNDDYQRIAGRQIKMQLNNLVGTPGFIALPRERQIKLMMGQIDKGRKAGAHAVQAASLNTANDIVQKARINKMRQSGAVPAQ